MGKEDNGGRSIVRQPLVLDSKLAKLFQKEICSYAQETWKYVCSFTLDFQLGKLTLSK